jgi:CRISPR-associated protein Cmr5
MVQNNLEQIRAFHALQFSREVEQRCRKIGGKNGGNAIRKIPAMIMANGLMATLAFSLDKTKKGLARPGYCAILDGIAEHLADEKVQVVERSANTAHKLLKFLAENDSVILQRATREALAWLAYARRFVKAEDQEEGGQEE